MGVSFSASAPKLPEDYMTKATFKLFFDDLVIRLLGARIGFVELHVAEDKYCLDHLIGGNLVLMRPLQDHVEHYVILAACKAGGVGLDNDAHLSGSRCSWSIPSVGRSRFSPSACPLLPDNV